MANENNPTPEYGQLHIADEVISVVAATAAMEVEGIHGLGIGFTGDFVERIGGRKNSSKGVKVSVKDGSVKIFLSLFVKFGYKIQDAAFEVQRRVKAAIETMTGMTVSDVNIVVAGVVPEKKKA